MKLEMLSSYVRAKRLPPNTHQKTELIIIPNGREVFDGGATFDDWLYCDSFECEVLELGPGELLKDGTREDLEIKVGDRVVIPQGHESSNNLPDGSFIVDISAVEAIVEREVL